MKQMEDWGCGGGVKKMDWGGGGRGGRVKKMEDLGWGEGGG